jgi:ATP-dependent DNA ligase
MTAKTPKDVDAAHATFLSEGYEGSIIRLHNGLYEADKRSKSLLKRKDFQDEEFLCVDVIEADNQPGSGVFVCVTEDGAKFKATPKCSHAERQEILRDKETYIGKEITVVFFGKNDATKIPRFPIGLRAKAH